MCGQDMRHMFHWLSPPLILQWLFGPGQCMPAGQSASLPHSLIQGVEEEVSHPMFSPLSKDDDDDAWPCVVIWAQVVPS